MRREIDTMERDITRLRRRERASSPAPSTGLRNDPAYIEKLAREELGMVAPGETRAEVPLQPPAER